MYELKDTYFFIFDTPALIKATGVIIILAIAGYFFVKAKKRSNHN